jgi:hypothetical protein
MIYLKVDVTTLFIGLHQHLSLEYYLLRVPPTAPRIIVPKNLFLRNPENYWPAPINSLNYGPKTVLTRTRSCAKKRSCLVCVWRLPDTPRTSDWRAPSPLHVQNRLVLPITGTHHRVMLCWIGVSDPQSCFFPIPCPFGFCCPR